MRNWALSWQMKMRWKIILDLQVVASQMCDNVRKLFWDLANCTRFWVISQQSLQLISIMTIAVMPIQQSSAGILLVAVSTTQFLQRFLFLRTPTFKTEAYGFISNFFM